MSDSNAGEAKIRQVSGEQEDKIRGAAKAISKLLESHNVSYGEALSALAFSLVVAAKSSGISKEFFLQVLEADWEAMQKNDSVISH